MADWLSIQLTTEPLDAAAALAEVTVEGVGGVDVFVGITRAEASAERGTLLQLDYHAYEEMAIAELGRIAERARGSSQITRAAVWHRLGPVAVGEASVVVAVGAPHRHDAFVACRYIIDELKKLAPLWKREIYTLQTRWQIPSDPPSP